MTALSTKDTMSSKERLAALATGRALDRVPFNPFSSGFSARVSGMDRGEFYRNPEKAFEAGLNLMKEYPWMSTRPTYGWADRGAWEFGGQVCWPDNDQYAAPFSPAPVISSPDEVDSLPAPDPRTAGMNPLVARFNEISRNHGFPAALPGGTPTSMSSGIVGKSRFLTWIVRYPELVHKLQRKVTDFILQTAELTIEQYGAENCSVMCAVPMESNQLISPSVFESFCKPYIQEIMGAYAASGVRMVLVHLCGDHMANLPHWADIPLPPRTVFSIGRDMDLAATGKFLGHKHILAGNIDSATLQTGSAEQVKAEVIRCLDAAMSHPGGFVLMPACELPPDTPRENIEYIAEALFEHGYYGEQTNRSHEELNGPGGPPRVGDPAGFV